MIKRLLSYSVGLVILLTVYLVVLCTMTLVATLPGVCPPSDPRTSLYAAASIAIPVGVALFAAHRTIRFLLRIFDVTPFHLSRTVVAVLLVGYVFTAVLGVPAIQSQNSTWAMDEYQKLNAGHRSDVWTAHPYFRTYASLPVLPLVVLTYHEYQLAGLYGWGGWDLQVWYGAGVIRLFKQTLWVS
jgi:hypothetical protein